MEWKIGEIRQINGEWYQCVESDSCGKCSLSTTECGSGTKSDFAMEVFGNCSKLRRSDNEHVIFKKLEKVGEPYKFGRKLMQKYNIYAKPYLSDDYGYIYIPGRYNEVISIEIKQTKEDMEEKNLNLKPFDIQKAREGKPVCTRDGRKARIICFDKKCLDGQVLIVLVDCGKEECMYFYTTDGKCIDDFSSFDLMMLPEKKEGWVNIYYEHDAPSHREASWVYDKEEEAIKVGKEHGSCYIATVRIGWEE